MQQYDDDAAERITPHILVGDEREEYLDRLWAAFTEVATAGVIALQTAHNIVEDLSIDGEERFLETHIPKEKWQHINFEDLIYFVDEMSRAASAEYQDAAEATREAKINAGIEGGSVEGDVDESALKLAVRRKFSQFVEIMSTPKILLIASTNAVMIVVSVALIIGLAVTWNHESQQWFKEHISIVQAISASAIDSIMRDMEREQHESLEHVTKLMSTWLSFQMQLSQQQTHEAGVTQRLRRVSSNIAAVHGLANARTYETGYIDALKEIHRRYEIALSDSNSTSTSFNSTDSNSTNTTAAGASPILLPDKVLQTQFASRTTFRAASCASAAVATARADPRQGNESITVIPFTDDSLCLIAEVDDTLNPHAMQAVEQMNRKMPPHYGYVTVFERGYSAASAVDSPFTLSGNTTPSLGCLDDNMINFCAHMGSIIDPTAQMQTHRDVPFLFNQSYYISLRKVIEGTTYVGLALSTLSKQGQLQEELISFADVANDPTSDIATKLGWRIDIAIRNLTNGEVIPRASTYAGTNCVPNCDLPDLTKNIILRSFENGTSAGDGTGTYPIANYTPVTLTHAFSDGLAAGVDFVTYLSSPRISEKESMFARLISAINDLNAANIGEFESVIIGLEHMPPVQTFYAYDTCPDDVFCIVDNRTNSAGRSLGTIYRYDCRNCQRIDKAEETLGEAVILTDPWRVGRRYAAEGCKDRSCMQKIPSQREYAVRHLGGRGEETNYAGDNVMYVNTYMNDWSILVESQIKKKDLSSPVYEILGVAVGVSVVVLLLGIAALWFFADRNFGIIEKDWAHFKKQIQREKDRFAGLVKGFIPPHIVDRMVGGHRVLVDQTQGSTFTFIDLCAFSNESKTWQPKQISRYLAYCFFVMEECAAKYGVMKLRTIGDLFCAVASRLERSKDSKEDHSQHPVRRSMDMSATLMLLFSPSYEHYPQNSKNFRDIFKERQQDGRPTPMPVLRIGMHLGPAVGGAFSVGNTSHFDFFGAGPALANRMQLTALPGRIHVTSVVREALKARDPEHCYTFDTTRKTIVRGQGTIASYFVKSVLISAPTSLTEPMGIRPATKRVDFTVVKKKGTDSNASEQSESGS